MLPAVGVLDRMGHISIFNLRKSLHTVSRGVRATAHPLQRRGLVGDPRTNKREVRPHGGPHVSFPDGEGC